MKYNDSNLPELTLKYKTGEVKKMKISESKDAANVFREIWDKDSILICETFIVLFLNRSNVTIGWYKVSQGGLTGTIVDNRLILATALNCLATSIVLCHNHPSGNVHPSETDIATTKKLVEVCKMLEISVLDHLILTEDNYHSMADNSEI